MNPPKAKAGLQFSVALSRSSQTARAIDEVVAEVQQQIGASPDLAMVFVSHHHGPDFEPLTGEISERTGARSLLGCTGEAIVGGAREVEGQPALALWAARLPGVSIYPMHIEFEQTVEGGSFVGWADDLPEQWPERTVLLTLGEPFTFPADQFLSLVNEDHPGVPVVGGMASGGWSPGQNRLLLGGRELDQGAVVALLHGPLQVRTVVSQGCRPVGRHFVVTKAQDNVIVELGGQPPLVRLQEVLETVSSREQQLVRQGLHVGRVINEYQDRFERGDFLVRNVIGANPGNGAIAIGDLAKPGQTVQFHIRDAETADEDLRALMSTVREGEGAGPLAALLFTCNGRGTKLFSRPHHDASVLHEYLGEIPVAGFFAQGELGPIGGQNFIHGFTASVVLFEQPQSD